MAEEETEEAKGKEETETEAEAAAATGTREAAVASQARYLSRVDVLLRFSGGGGGGAGGSGAAEKKAGEVARRCGEKLLLGGLPALAALWQSLEDLRSTATAPPLLQDAYRAALQELGVCVEAASGYWGVAKLLQLQVSCDWCPPLHRQQASMNCRLVQQRFLCVLLVGRSIFRVMKMFWSKTMAKA